MLCIIMEKDFWYRDGTRNVSWLLCVLSRQRVHHAGGPPGGPVQDSRGVPCTRKDIGSFTGQEEVPTAV